MEIVPKPFGENLNEWFRVMGRAWKPLLLASLVAFLPVSLITAGILAFTGSLDAVRDLTDPDYLAALPDSELLAEFWPLMVVGAMWIFLQSIATLFVHLASSRIVAEDRAGLTPSWQSAAGIGFRRLVQALLAALLAFIGFSLATGLAVAVGLLAIDLLGTEFLAIFVTTVAALTTFVALIWAALSISLYPQVLAMELVGAATALQRSFSLVRKRWWVTFGFVLVTTLIASAASQVLGIVLAPLSIMASFAPQALAVVYLIAGLLQGPVAAAIGAGNAIWYLDLRSREEPLVTDQIV